MTCGSSAPKELVTRVGTSRRYRLTPAGVRLGMLLVKLRSRLLGPLVTLASQPPRPRLHSDSPVEAAYRKVGHALEELISTLALRAA